MLIPTNVVIANASEVKDGHVGMECTICKKIFSVPAEDAAKIKENEALVCSECGAFADKAAAEASAAAMKTNDAASTIDTALGK